MQPSDDLVTKFLLENELGTFVNAHWGWKEHPIVFRVWDDPDTSWISAVRSLGTCPNYLPEIFIHSQISSLGLLTLRFMKVLLLHELGHLDDNYRTGKLRTDEKVISEYIADKFVIDKGYGNDLLWALHASIQTSPNNPMNKLRLANVLKLVAAS